MALTEDILTVRVPVIETVRLTLRAFRDNDLEEYAALIADPIVSRFLGDGRPISRMEAWRQIAMITGHWMLRGFGLWAVEERESRALVGRIGLHEPAGWPGFELAYTLGRTWWGRGYAQEAGRASLHHARDVMGRDEIISIIRPDNAGSIKVATALGAERAEMVEFFGAPSVIYRYPRAAG
jgi:RimJ/RimL family protein N-acetyltransferase